MSSTTDTRLTPGQRLTRGLRYTALGPVDVTRGALGIGVTGAQSSASWVGDRYRHRRGEPARDRRRRRPLLLVVIGVVVLAGGAVAFSIVRRSTRPEPSPLAPSVEVAPRP